MKYRWLYRLCACSFFLLSHVHGFSQDLIIRVNNDTIRAKVLDIRGDNIKFKRYGASKADPVLEIKKNTVKEIVYENGTRLKIIYDIHYLAPDKTVSDHNHAIKLDFVAPVFNHITIGYEHQIAEGKNIEIKASLIGPGISSALDHSSGYFFKAGLKFVFVTEHLMNGLEYTPGLPGNYIKPEFIYGKYFSDEENGRINYTNYAFVIVFGKQFVVDNWLTFDYFGGAGFGNQKSSYNQISPYDENTVDFKYAYSHIFFGRNLPLVLTGGLTIGIAF